MGEGLGGEQLQGLVVVDVAVLDHAAVAVVGVLAQADIGDHGQLRNLGLDGADGLLDDAGVAVGVLAHGVLGFGDAEQDDRRNAELVDFPGFGHDVLDGLLVDPRHGRDLLLDPLAEGAEHRIDQVVDPQVGFTDHAPQVGGAAQATAAVFRKEHDETPRVSARSCGPSGFGLPGGGRCGLAEMLDHRLDHPIQGRAPGFHGDLQAEPPGGLRGQGADRDHSDLFHQP